MIALALLRLLLPVAAAWPWIRGLPGMERPGRRGLAAAMALGAGLAIPAALHGAVVLAAGPPGAGFAVLEGAAFAALGLLGLRRGRRAAEHPAPPPPPQAILSAVFAVLALSGFVLFLGATLRDPDGGWDGWAMWNLKARFLAEGGAGWVHALSPRIGWSSPDYPLLLPGAVARLWPGEGHGSRAVPALVALLFAAGTVGLLTGAVAALRGRAAGLLAGILLLGTPAFLVQAPAQCADVPLAFFVLASMVALALHAEGPPGGRAWLVAAGFAAGCAAWTKNEGLLYASALGCGWLLQGVLRRRAGETARELAAMAAGALPLLALLAWFRWSWAPPGLLFAGLDGEVAAARLLDAQRHGTVLSILARKVLLLGPPLLGLLLLLPRAEEGGRPAATAGWTALALAGAGIYTVYLLTPFPLDWHVSTSGSRLLLQAWPAALFLAILRAGGGRILAPHAEAHPA